MISSWNTETIEKFFIACGGKQNIKNIYTCLTRLRIKFNNDDIVYKDNFQKLALVKTVFEQNNELQLVIGLEAASICDTIKLVLEE